jgi:hypothetical protein
MPSWIQICNQALYRLGEPPLTLLTDNTKSAIGCNNCYEQARDEVLEENDWYAARVRAALAADVTAPSWGFGYRYALPTNPYCLKVIEIESNPGFAVEGRYILCDTEDGLNILYTGRIVDPTGIPPLLAKAISWRLALILCRAIVQSSSMQEALMQEYNLILKDAKQQNAMQFSVDDEDQNSSETGNAEWLNAGR